MKATLQLIFAFFLIYIYRRSDPRSSNRTIVSIETTDVVPSWEPLKHERPCRKRERERKILQTLYRTYRIDTLHNDSNKALPRVGVGSQPRSCPRPRSLFLTSSRPQSKSMRVHRPSPVFHSLRHRFTAIEFIRYLSHALLLFEKFTVACFLRIYVIHLSWFYYYINDSNVYKRTKFHSVSFGVYNDFNE